MASGESHYGAGDLLSVPGLRKDGQRISLEFTIVPLKDEQGQMHGLAAVMRDVTSRFEEIRKTFKQKLAESNRTPEPPLTGMANPFYTIGHSTRSILEFVDLLREANVCFVVDVRTVPPSGANPQFNRDALPESLAGYQIGYEHIAELGGLRGRQRLAEPSPQRLLGEHKLPLADYALTGRFRAGLDHLVGGSRRPEHAAAIMCAEAVWWRCHRRIIADYLLASGPAPYFTSSDPARSSRRR